MPTPTEIRTFLIGKTIIDRDAVQRWLNYLGADEFEMPDGDVSDPALLIALAGKRCYMSFQPSLNPNVTRIRREYVDYFDNILKSGHGSVLEHSVYNMAVEGVTRVFTAEMNRHRAGWAISEGSLRFIRFGENVPYWEPDSIRGPDVLPDQVVDGLMRASAQDVEDWARCPMNLDEKKHASRLIFRRAFVDQESAYRTLQSVWANELGPESKFAGKKQITSMMRRVIGLGVSTGGVWSGNIRALRHVFTMRCSPAAEEEMIHVFSRVVMEIKKKEPMLFGDFEQDENGHWRPKYVKV